jgi:hypothetical protein
LREERRLRVFGNRVLRGIFRPKRHKVTGEWRKLHDEVVNSLYSSPIIVGDKIENHEMGGACSVYGGEERRIHGTNHLEDPGLNGRVVLRWIFRKWDVGYGLDRAGSG